jgi:hypothetical protein
MLKWEGSEGFRLPRRLWTSDQRIFICCRNCSTGRWTKSVYVKGELFTCKAREAIVIVIFTLSRQRFANRDRRHKRTDLRPCVAADKNVRAPFIHW